MVCTESCKTIREVTAAPHLGASMAPADAERYGEDETLIVQWALAVLRWKDRGRYAAKDRSAA
jgi:hypothetical protein